MARGGGGNGGGWTGGGARRDQDEASWNKKSYRRDFDPRDEENTGSRYSEIQSQIQQGFEHAGDADDAMQQGQNSVKFWPSVGKFIIPKTPDGQVSNRWEAHAALVKDPENAIGFDPDKYIFFDKIIAERFGNRALTDPTHKHYASFEGLRTNIAILRNDTIGMYLRDGSFDPGDEIFVPSIQGIAETLGDALANDRLHRKLFTDPLDVDVANVEGVGAQEMYKYLLSVQSEPGIFQGFVKNIRTVIGLPIRDWYLPPLEDTPFSDDNLRPAPANAAPPANGVEPDAPQPGNPQLPNAPLGGGDIERMVAFSETIGRTVQPFAAVDTLNEPDRKQSVIEAHTILRGLKNWQGNEMDLEKSLGEYMPGEPMAPEQLARAEAYTRLVQIYSEHLQEMRRAQPERAYSDPVIAEADQAASALALAVIERTLDLLPEGHPAQEKLIALSFALPEQADALQNQSVIRLVEAIERGIEQASPTPVNNRPPLDRLNEMTQRLTASARKLRSVDEMAPPPRREAVDLAHKILRGWALEEDASRERLVDSGTIQEKATLAERIAEKVEMYANILFDAVRIQPELLNDPRIKDANDAVDNFAHAFSLMAAKEMPGNLAAAAQRISAVDREAPNELKNLDAHMVERLAKGLEGAAQAIDDMIEQQQQQQEQQQIEDRQEQTELASSTDRSRRKRGRRRSSGGGLTRNAKRRNAGDLNGDGVDDKVQGLKIGQNATQPIKFEVSAVKPNAKTKKVDGKTLRIDAKAEKATPFLQGVNSKDMETIRKLGGDLHKISKEVKESSTALANVSTSDKIIPDDKNFAVRNMDRELQQQQKPKGL